MKESHIRVGVRVASRRINGDRGATGRNLCGADVTDIDVVYRDAKRIVTADCKAWPLCTACRDIYRAQQAGDVR